MFGLRENDEKVREKLIRIVNNNFYSISQKVKKIKKENTQNTV